MKKSPFRCPKSSFCKSLGKSAQRKITLLCLQLLPVSRFCNLDLKSAVSAQAAKSQRQSFCKSSAGFIIVTFSPPSLSPLLLPRGDGTWVRL